MFFIINSNSGGDTVEYIASKTILTDANNRVSNIIAVDVQVSNDVTHVIDEAVIATN